MVQQEGGILEKRRKGRRAAVVEEWSSLGCTTNEAGSCTWGVALVARRWKDLIVRASIQARRTRGDEQRLVRWTTLCGDIIQGRSQGWDGKKMECQGKADFGDAVQTGQATWRLAVLEGQCRASD